MQAETWRLAPGACEMLMTKLCHCVTGFRGFPVVKGRAAQARACLQAGGPLVQPFLRHLPCGARRDVPVRSQSMMGIQHPLHHAFHTASNIFLPIHLERVWPCCCPLSPHSSLASFLQLSFILPHAGHTQNYYGIWN